MSRDTAMQTHTPMPDKPVAYVLVGLPGSGKSTWAAAHPEGLPIASTDVFIEAYAARQQITYAEAFNQFEAQAKLLLRQRLNELIASKASFIWDQTNITARKRRAVYNKLSPTHRVIYVCFCVPVDVCVARVEARERQAGEVINRKQIKLWSSMVTFPEPGEPCDGIIPIIHPAFAKRPNHE
jgi:predicted kinase